MWKVEGVEIKKNKAHLERVSLRCVRRDKLLLAARSCWMFTGGT